VDVWKGAGKPVGTQAFLNFLLYLRFPNTTLFIMPIPFPVKAKWAVLGFIAFDLFGGVTGRGGNVAHFAHLGGALTGFILVLIWNKTGTKRFY
jgi:membrane associated rhomboid family serine protease